MPRRSAAHMCSMSHPRGMNGERLRGMEINDSSWIILGVAILMLVGVIYGYYTVSGSGISERPYRKIYGGAPGAFGPASASGKDSTARVTDWSRGTR